MIMSISSFASDMESINIDILVSTLLQSTQSVDSNALSDEKKDDKDAPAVNGDQQ